MLEFAVEVEMDIESWMERLSAELDEIEQRYWVDSLSRELDKVGEVRLGIDLEERGIEVKKLLYAGFGGKMWAGGYDPEEVYQEVCRGILARNKGTCPWDSRKSSFGHYVHMVISCVLTNYHRRESRRSVRVQGLSVMGREVTGWWTERSRLDTGLDSHVEGVGFVSSDLGEYLEGLSGGRRAEVGREIYPLVVEGYTRAEIVERTGLTATVVSRAISWVKGSAAKWAESVGAGHIVPKKYST
jgi:DNA-directed RNA polymerase specialized sigma24 family protein